MLPNRFRITTRASRIFGNLKAATGITPNILCRYAFALSIREGKKGGLRDLVLDGNEFNMSTLFGEHAEVYEFVLRSVHGEISSKQIVEVVGSHIEDGVDALRGYMPIKALLLGTSRRADRFDAFSIAPEMASNP
jgi:DNA sulfur modification protein DndE